MARKARLISRTLGVDWVSPSAASAQGLVPFFKGGSARLAVFFEGGFRDGHGGSPRSTRLQATAHRASISARGRPAAPSAARRASSWVRAPPLDASGLRKGAASGGAVHHAAHRKRRRFVAAIDTALAKREWAMFSRAHQLAHRADADTLDQRIDDRAIAEIAEGTLGTTRCPENPESPHAMNIPRRAEYDKGSSLKADEP
jgi:hypothetical protein